MKSGSSGSLLEYPKHSDFKRFMKDLQHLYLTEPAFYDGEYNSACFRWLEADAAEERVYVYERMSAGQNFIVVINMSDEQYNNFEFGYDRNAVLLLMARKKIYRLRSRDTNGGNGSLASWSLRWRLSCTVWSFCRSRKKKHADSHIFRIRV